MTLLLKSCTIVFRLYTLDFHNYVTYATVTIPIYETLELNPSRSVSLHQHVSLSISDRKVIAQHDQQVLSESHLRIDTFCAPLLPDQTHRPGSLPLM